MRGENERGLGLARTALAGNPSDGYGGAVLAVTFANFHAEVKARRAPGLIVDPPSELVSATVARFARELAPAALHTALSWRTTIPRAVGLGGSSAIVTATARALCELYEVGISPADLAELALAVEREDLGVVGGRQDQVVQAYGGLVYMDFGQPSRYEPLDPGLLPLLLVAYRADAAQHSGQAHVALRARFRAQEPIVLAAIDELNTLARQARDALVVGDHVAFGRAVDASFDVRTVMMALDSRHTAMIERARSLGANANYSGSGGAIVCVCRDERHRTAVAGALAALRCESFSPATLAPDAAVTD